ncbi:MAG: HD domain-containing protein [Patescibacteria group bacterium]
MIFREEEFKEFVRPHLEKCRAGDWEHCQRVVFWVKELGAGRPDLELLIVAGYLHDVGWWDILPDQKIYFQQLLNNEKQAAENTKPYITEIMGAHGYTQSDVEKVVRLAKAADAHEANAEDEAILVDADSLSKLSIDHLKQKYIESDWVTIFEGHYMNDIVNRLKTEKAKQICPGLIEQLKKDLYNSPA